MTKVERAIVSPELPFGRVEPYPIRESGFARRSVRNGEHCKHGLGVGRYPSEAQSGRIPDFLIKGA
jgi:hypothetical protein